MKTKKILSPKQKRAKAYNHSRGLCKNVIAQMELIEKNIRLVESHKLDHGVCGRLISISANAKSLEKDLKDLYFEGVK